MAEQGQSFIQSWFGQFLPGVFSSPSTRENITARNLNAYISPVQLQRLRHDVAMWREAITEAENAWYPQRVRMQRMFVDTILNGHTLACYQKRKDLTLQRDWTFKDSDGNENEDLKKLFNKKWFADFISFAIDARFFGYSLISLGDVENNGFPQMKFIRRWNISPDRLNVTQLVYSLSGAQFMDEPYCNWHVWIPTTSDTGSQDCGYGLLYNVALYEIMGRTLLGNNATAAELYGMPARVVKTDKTAEKERAELFNAVVNMGSEPALMTDLTDIVELLESKGNGQGFKIYPDLEKRLESKISKLILGHADAIDSTPGKLGENTAPAEALESKMLADGAFVEDVVNSTLIPKLINLGFVIDPTFKLTFSNNIEIDRAERLKNSKRKDLADIAYTLKQAGKNYDSKQLSEEMDITITDIPVAPVTQKNTSLTPEKKEAIKNLYKNHKH